MTMCARPVLKKFSSRHAWMKKFRVQHNIQCANPGGGGALGPNMYGCVPLRCCDLYPVWEHFP